MRFLPNTLRMRLVVVLTALVGIISLAVYIYFPSKLRNEALRAVAAKAESIAQITAYNGAPALVFDDRTAAYESFEGARRNRDLAYLVVHDAGGSLFAEFGLEAAIASRFLEGRAGRVTADGELYQTSHPILHNNREIGRLYMGLSLADVNAQIARSRTTVALLSLILFLFGVSAVTVVSTLVTQPLRRIVDVVEKIAAGETDRRADVTTRDEIGHLARSFNAMVDQLEWLQHDLEARVEDRTRALKQEIQERRHAEEALRSSETRYRLLFERNLAGVYRTTIEGQVLDCNEACARMFGFDSPEEVIRTRVGDHFFDPVEREDLIRRLERERSIPNVELHMRRRDGSSIWILESLNLLEDESGQPHIIEGTIIDITARKESERQIEHQAYHDTLTGLPNRALFTDRLSIALARARRKQSVAAVMFLDLDRFKYVNDTFGHSAGDLLLVQAAHRLRTTVREEDTVARIGGDEFTFLLSDLGDPSDAAKVAEKLIDVMGQPFVIEGHELFVTASIGIALFPADGRDSETLLGHADNAMYRAKEMGRNNYQAYSTAVGKRAAQRLSLEAALRRAVEREEFVVHYQPQIDVARWEIVGVEALVRWENPSRGLLHPDQFLTLAEETKLIARIDEWVIREACRASRTWENAGVMIPRVAVNVSAGQLHNRDLQHVIRRALEESSLPAARMELEITESTAIQTGEETIELLRGLREAGLRISIDDFGMGHSALHYLHRFPLDSIKIDKTFVAAIGAGTRSGGIITAIVAMAAALRLNVVAEGVETNEQLAFLKQLGCTEIQGHLFSSPVPAPQLLELARRNSAQPREPRLSPRV